MGQFSRENLGQLSNEIKSRFYWESDYATVSVNQTPGELADAAMGAIEKAACASVNLNVTLTTPQQVACSKIQYWQTHPLASPPTTPTTSAILAKPLADIQTWTEGRQLLNDASSIGVSYVADNIPEPPGTEIFGYFDLTNRQIHINTNEMNGANDWVIAGIVVHELRHASDFAHGLLARDTAVHCYSAEARAFLTQGSWYDYAQDNMAQATGPMVAQLWGIHEQLQLLQIAYSTGDQSLYDYATRLVLDDWLGPYMESCGTLP